MRASVSSTREPMKRESRPSSEQGLASAVNLAGAFDHEFTQTTAGWEFLDRGCLHRFNERKAWFQNTLFH